MSITRQLHPPPLLLLSTAVKMHRRVNSRNVEVGISPESFVDFEKSGREYPDSSRSTDTLRVYPSLVSSGGSLPYGARYPPPSNPSLASSPTLNFTSTPNFNSTATLLMNAHLSPPKVEEKPAAPAAPSFPDGGKTAWLTVLGVFFGLFGTFGQLYAFGAFQAYYATHQLQDKTASEISWIGSVQLGVFFAAVSGLETFLIRSR